jgi:carboxymethylenebutenolidase
MSRTDVKITTPDGAARAYAFTPGQGQGPWPGVIFFMDGLAIRQTLFDMAQRLADHGYYVLLPDMFWRIGDYPPIDVSKVFTDPDVRNEVMTKFMPSTDPQKSTRDTGAFLDWLAKQPQVKGQKVGTTGYCMGGGISLRAAGEFPDRVAAAAAFHPGGLATDAPDSPHLLAPKIKAEVYVGGADKDDYFDPAQKDRLAKALADAGVKAEVTIYPGALHGYAPQDTPAYNKEASERHWREMTALFDRNLK